MEKWAEKNTHPTVLLSPTVTLTEKHRTEKALCLLVLPYLRLSIRPLLFSQGQKKCDARIPEESHIFSPGNLPRPIFSNELIQFLFNHAKKTNPLFEGFRNLKTALVFQNRDRFWYFWGSGEVRGQ